MICLKFMYAACRGNLLNTAVTVGEDVAMSCEIDMNSSAGLWTLDKLFKRQQIQATNFPRHKVSSPHSNCTNLSINSTEMNDAGRYTCFNSATLMSYSAELIVIGKVSVCSKIPN